MTVATIMIVATSLLAACGNGGGPAESSAGSHAAAEFRSGPTYAAPHKTESPAAGCNYISASQLSSIEGAIYAAPTIFADRLCTWVSNDSAIDIEVTRNATPASWAQALALIEGDQRSGPAAVIPGLGDKAAGVGKEIAVQYGDAIITIRDADSPGYGRWPKSTAIAKAIIAGLH
jgi:hypothetical protein